MVMDVRLVYMCADDIRMIPLGKAPRQLLSQPVRFLRRDLARNKRLPQMIGDYVLSADPSRRVPFILLQRKMKLGVCHSAVAFKAGNEPLLIRLFRILHIIQYFSDGLSNRPPLSDMQRHNPRRCHSLTLSKRKNASCIQPA